MTVLLAPMCLGCRHLRPVEPGSRMTCEAFPDAIPAEILDWTVDHRQPVPGDNGVRLDPESPSWAEYVTSVLGPVPAPTGNGYAAHATVVELGYSPGQKRDTKGRFGSGGGAGAGGGGSEAGEPSPYDRKLYRPAGFAEWGASHYGSAVITGTSAGIMGIPGYKGPLDVSPGDVPSDVLVRQAPQMLAVIAADGVGATEPLYHGFRDRAATEWKAGDTLDHPLLAASGDAMTSAGYGSTNPHEPKPGQATLFVYPKGTPMVPYSRNSRVEVDSYDLDHTWGEAVVAGRFKVTRVHDEKGSEATYDQEAGQWNKKPGNVLEGVLTWADETVRVVELEPTHTFDPGTKAWRPTRTELLGE